MDIKKLWKNSSLLGGNNRLYEKYSESAAKRVVDKFGSRKDPAESSVYGRFMAWLDAKLARTNNLPFDKIICYAFPFYLLIEYVLRDVLGIALLSSVWEELFIAAALLTVFIKGRFARVNSVEVVVAIYMLVCLILCLINRPYPSVAFAGYRAQVEYMVWFFLLIRMFRSKKDARLCLFLFLGFVLVLSFHGFYQFIIKVEIPSSWTSQTESSVRTRVFSITGSPNIFGDLLLMAAPIAASLMYYLKKPWQKLCALCATGVLCICMLFTFSKGAWLGLIVAIVIFSILVDGRLLLLMGTAMAAILALFPQVTSRITYLFTNDYAEASAVGGRTMRWQLGRSLLLENKWLGFGLGRYGGAVAMNNQILDKTEEFAYYYLDNYYLKTLVETGYIGLVFYLFVLAALIVFGLKAIYKAGSGFETDHTKDHLFANIGNDKMLCAGIFSALCGVLTHCLFENIFEEPYMMAYFWGLAAILIYLGRKEET